MDADLGDPMTTRPDSPRCLFRSRVLPALALLLALLTMPAPRADAQELRLSAAHTQTSDPLWGNPTGWAMAVVMPAADRLSFVIGVSAFSSRATRVGTICAGGAAPSGCAPEPLKDLARLLDVRLGVAGRVFQREKLAISIVADGHWVEGNSDTTAPASARALSATEGYWGPGVGLDVSWKPNPTGALGFFATGGAVWWIPRDSNVDTVGGYEPFNETVRAPSFSLGASWAVRVF
jgi:hypothetical protein